MLYETGKHTYKLYMIIPVKLVPVKSNNMITHILLVTRQ